MSRFNHNICSVCWYQLRGPQEPHRIVNPSPEDVCCFCGGVNIDGIYVRQDPADPLLLCKGDCDGFKAGIIQRGF